MSRATVVVKDTTIGMYIAILTQLLLIDIHTMCICV